MDVAAIRSQLAAAAATVTVAGRKVHGYPSPRKAMEFPAVYIGDPDLIEYHGTMRGHRWLTAAANVAVARGVDDDKAAAALDALVSYGAVPAALETFTPTGGVYRSCVVQRLEGGYREAQIGPDVPALVARLVLLIDIPPMT
jgi:hypothetical protein